MRLHALLPMVVACLLLWGCGTPATTATSATESVPAATVGSLSISDVWARATAMGGSAGGMVNNESTAEAGMAATTEADMSGQNGEMGGMRMGASYMTIANTSVEADTLIQASADVANTVELHTVVEENGVMRMRPVENGIAVPGSGNVVLKPGGYHIMLIGLTKELKAGDTVNLTLQFEKAGEVAVVAEVRE